MSQSDKPRLGAQPAAVERRNTNVTMVETDGEVTRERAVESVVETATFGPEPAPEDEMPLPTGPA